MGGAHELLRILIGTGVFPSENSHFGNSKHTPTIIRKKSGLGSFDRVYTPWRATCNYCHSQDGMPLYVTHWEILLESKLVFTAFVLVGFLILIIAGVVSRS